MKNIFRLFLLAGVVLFTSLSLTAAESSPRVLVSIAPYRYFVEQLAPDLEVEVVVPAGADLHTFEPTPRQVLSASHAHLWFRLGEIFEERLLPVLHGYNPSMRVVDLREGIDLIIPEGHHHCCHAHGGADLHIWLSPREVKKQVEVMADALIDLMPERTVEIVANLQTLLKELDKLDGDVQALLKRSRHKQVLVSHPAYGYFCRDYGLEQITLEQHGKEPSPRQITELVERAKKLKLARVFVVGQFSRKAAQIVADELGAEIIDLDPYLEDYPTMILTTARGFAGK